MKFSLITASYNRAYAISALLDSVAVSIRHANLHDEAEIVIVDNRSTDTTAEVIDRWAAANPDIQIQHLFEAMPGTSNARNCGIMAARGALLAFTDDDCLLTPDYITTALAYDAQDSEPVFRGGRVERANANDLPLTIKTQDTSEIWCRAERSARRKHLMHSLVGCNMTIRKSTFDILGLFDTRLGPGSRFHGSEDIDLYYRAYLSGMKLIYVPDMTVLHNHGRRTAEDGNKLMRSYVIASGALFAKYLFRHLDFTRPLMWDIRNGLRELRAGHNILLPEYDFSYGDMLRGYAHGMLLYFAQSLGFVSRHKRTRA